MMRFGIALVLCGLTTAVFGQRAEQKFNDYPTDARADYVFACMASNGKTSDTLRRCSCSIDVIASIISYDKYIEAETVLSLRQTGGERMAIFRTSPSAKLLVANLRRAQAEADILCF